MAYTEQLYYQNPYETVFMGTVLECYEEKGVYKVVCDRTLFYPEGGGQPADKGLLGGVPVLDVKEKQGTVIHVLEQPLAVGQTVEGKIDWDYRFDLMQNHTGEHIVSGIIYQTYGFHNVGFHMGKEVITVDLDGKLGQEEIEQIEEKANQAVFENQMVNSNWYSEDALNKIHYRSKKRLEGKVRIVEVPGYDVCACCGLHVGRTGEIGCIKILSCENYKGGVRLSMVCGKRALKDYEQKNKIFFQLSQLLSVPGNRIWEAAKALMEERDQYRYRKVLLERKILTEKAAALPENMERGIFFFEEGEAKELRNFCNTAVQKTSEYVILFVGTDEKGYNFMIGSHSIDVREKAQELCKRFHGKGGGSKNFLQGHLIGKRSDLEAFLKSSF